MALRWKVDSDSRGSLFSCKDTLTLHEKVDSMEEASLSPGVQNAKREKDEKGSNSQSDSSMEGPAKVIPGVLT